MRPLRRALAAATAVVVAAVPGACSASHPSAASTLASFLRAWDAGSPAAMAALVDRPPPDFAGSLSAAVSGLHAPPARHTAGPLHLRGAEADAPLTTVYDLPGVGPWTVTTTIHLGRRSGRWSVAWSPSTIAPGLPAGGHLALSYTWAPRAPILGAGGVPLTTESPQVVVGLEGSRITDPAGLAPLLEAAGATAAGVSRALSAARAHPDLFEAVLTLSEQRFEQLGGRTSGLYRAPGTVFHDTTTRTAVTPGLAAHLVGEVGPVTAEGLRGLGPPYGPASVVGLHGLEAVYEKRLAGTPGATVRAEDASGATVSTLASFPAHPGAPVTTSIDPATQRAAEAAMSSLRSSAALVAVRVSTGAILASAATPASGAFDLALAGTLPPGSTFKILTSTALIEAGLAPASPASCPPQAVVDGKVFRNAEGDAPVTDLAGAFAESCNTAFVALAGAHLRPSSFPAVAALYGLTAEPRIGYPASTGAVPLPASATDAAAEAIGQGRITVSPLGMALVAAAVGGGVARPATLVGDPAPQATPGQPTPLPPGVATGLRTMMASVVATGTAAGTGLPPGTFAKTGTAEYGSGSPPPTDAWLVGWRGDVAFAMVVQDSRGNGGPVDGPVVARFLSGLGSGGG